MTKVSANLTLGHWRDASPPGNDRGVDADGLPAIPASAGALVFDQAGRLLILEPTYKTGWTIPGGVIGGPLAKGPRRSEDVRNR